MSVAIAYAAPAVPAVGAGDPDAELLEALRRRDEDAYLLLVRRHTPLMMRVARRLLTQQAGRQRQRPLQRPGVSSRVTLLRLNRRSVTLLRCGRAQAQQRGGHRSGLATSG